MTHTMLIARTSAQLQTALATLRATHRRIALVPTMGALHEGHLALVAAGHQHADALAASIFVNPSQFGDAADLARYPRDEAGDLAKLRSSGCHLVWLPDVATIYPGGDSSVIEPAGPALGFEGAARPGHFAGVATVVAKLFGHIRPDAACFGEKDWQQLQVISRITTDLCLGVTIVPVPIVREPDGLALSSRNRFLDEAERRIAPALFRVLTQTARTLHAGANPHTTLTAARTTLHSAGFAVNYLDLIDGPSMQPTTTITPQARLITAAALGTVRLLDNVPIT